MGKEFEKEDVYVKKNKEKETSFRTRYFSPKDCIFFWEFKKWPRIHIKLFTVFISKTYDYTEWSKSDREGEILYDIPYIWNLKRNYTNELNCKRKRLTDLESKLMISGGGKDS